MESYFARYRNLLVLLALLVAQIIGLAMQVRRTPTGRTTFDRGDSSGVRLLRYWANALVSPPEKAVQTSRTGVGSIWSNYFDLRHVRQDNKDLQAEVDRLRLEQAALLEDAKQGERLQADLKFQQKYLYSTLAAQVIGTSGSDQSHVFYIDKGKDDGLARDMAVISANGIVGKVREVFPHSAQVLGINDQSSGAGVILEATRIRGILRGNAFGQLQIVGLLADNRIKPGEKILTAGGDQIFPRGLPVGEVQKIVPDPDRDGFIKIIVKPDAALDSLDEVLVITSTEPRFNSQQLKDMATSQELKGADATALADQQRASQIMAERLPGLTDPNAPPATPAANGQAANAPGSPDKVNVPKLIPPEHPDRFTPGYSGGSAETQSGSSGAAPETTGTASKPASAPGTRPAAKPAPPKSPSTQPKPQPQEKP